MRRREFVVSLSAVAPLVFGLRRVGGPVRFGVIADLHHGLAPDATWRLRTFVDAAKRRELDFVIQLGDFCYAKPSSAECVDLFNEITCPRHHVLGNHDMDFGSKADVMKVWGMPKPFYSFDVGGMHFVILDLNSIKVDGVRTPYEDSNFYIDAEQRAWADLEQLDWLRQDLADAAAPTVVFSHQPLGFPNRDGVIPGQQEEVLAVLRSAPAPGVAACLCGHLHVDRHESHDSMHCVCVNSASYVWRTRMRPYEDPLFAFITIEHDAMTIEGVTSRLARESDRREFADLDVKGFGATISDRELAIKASAPLPE